MSAVDVRERAAAAEQPIPSSRFRTAGPWVVLGLLLVAASVELMYLGRHLFFNYDEWDYVLYRQGHAAKVFLTPHNEHVSVVPIIVFKILLKAFGLSHYGAERLVNVLAVELTALFTYVYARPRIGAWAGIVPAVLVGFMGVAAEDIFWPFEMSLEIPLLCGVIVLLIFDARPRFGDPIACILLTIAVFSSGAGLAILAGATVEVLARRNWRSSLWVVLAPALLYGAWWLGYHAKTDVVHNAPYLLSFVTNAFASATGGLVALSADWGRIFAVVLVVAIWATYARRKSFPVRLTTLSVMALAYWSAIALLRGPEAAPGQGRYLFVGGGLVALTITELLRGRVPRPTPAGTAVTTVVVAAICLANLQLMLGFVPLLVDRVQIVLPELTAVELARDRLPRDFAFDPDRIPGGVVGPYLSAVDSYGSPALTERELSAAVPAGRQAADAILIDGAAPHIAKSRRPYQSADSPPTGIRISGGTRTDDRGCVVFHATQPGGAVTVSVPPRGLIVQAKRGPASVAARRFADTPATIGSVSPNMNGLLRFSPDRAKRPWTATVGTGGDARVCRPAP